MTRAACREHASLLLGSSRLDLILKSSGTKSGAGARFPAPQGSLCKSDSFSFECPAWLSKASCRLDISMLEGKSTRSIVLGTSCLG